MNHDGGASPCAPHLNCKQENSSKTPQYVSGVGISDRLHKEDPTLAKNNRLTSASTAPATNYAARANSKGYRENGKGQRRAKDSLRRPDIIDGYRTLFRIQFNGGISRMRQNRRGPLSPLSRCRRSLSESSAASSSQANRDKNGSMMRVTRRYHSTIQML